MLERGSPRAALIGRWGMALTLVTGAVLIGRLIRNFPYLLPNRLPGLVLYELGPALILVAAVGSAVVFTKEDGPRLGIPARLVLFALVATIAGTATLAARSEEHTSDPVTNAHLVCRLLLEKKKNN